MRRFQRNGVERRRGRGAGEAGPETTTGPAAASVPSLRSRLLTAALPILVAAAIIAAGWFIRVPNPTIHLEAQAETVTLDLVAPPRAQPDTITGVPALQKLSVEGFDEIRSDTEPLRVKPGAHKVGRIEFSGGAIDLNRIEIGGRQPPDGGKIADVAGYSLRARKSDARLLVDLFGSTPTLIGSTDGVSRGTIDLDGTVRQGPQRAASFEVVGSGTTKIAMLLKNEKAEMPLPVLRPVAIRFERQDYNAQGDPIRSSTIRSGTLSFSNDSQKRDLSPGSRLHLSALGGTANMRVNSDGMKIVFDGPAGMVQVEDHGQLQDARPNLVDWMISDRNVKILWTSLVFLSGLALSVFRVFRTPATPAVKSEN